MQLKEDQSYGLMERNLLQSSGVWINKLCVLPVKGQLVSLRRFKHEKLIR